MMNSESARTLTRPATELLLEVAVHAINMEETAGHIEKLIKERVRPSAYIVQANALSLVSAQENLGYRQAIGSADLVLPDGMPLVWLLRRLCHKDQQRVYGPDLMLRLCSSAAQNGWRCFLYGGEPGVPEQLGQELVRRFPGLLVVGTISPPFRLLSESEEEQVRTTVNSAHPDILWVGLGGPKQDTWMYEHREVLDVSVMHGVGAAFDFITGRVPQAPRWVMNCGFEWLFRLMMEPRRLWKRYTIINFKLIYYLLRSNSSK
jgi:N-acetylglucosaminyldiphosphoundecaprenol N-acetyl-beta-D-mannosaminyltransferase